MMFIGFVFAGLLAGCSLAGDSVTYVIVTGEPPADGQPPIGQVGQAPQDVVGQSIAQTIPTLPPTATPIPPTPTSDVDPQTALQMGDRYLFDGYLENAVLSYQNVLARDEAAPELRAAAAFNMGQAALREGLFDESVSALTTLITTFPNDTRIPQAYFLRGDAYLGLSEWQLALDDFRQYLALRPGLVDSYAYERIGDAQVALGALPDALNSYTAAADAGRSLAPGLALREKVARVYLTSGQIEQAVAQYDAILAVAENAPYRAQIEYAAASALLEGGQTELGLNRMQRVMDEYPATAQAYDALGVLLENGRTVNAYQRGRIAYFNGAYQEAITAFNEFTTETLLSGIPAELHLLLGRAYREVGNPEAALVAFQTIVEQYPTDPLFGEALLEQGRTRFLAGEIDQAIERYLAIASTYSTLTPTAAEALWRAGYLYTTNGRPEQGIPIFEQLADLYPNTTQAASGLAIAASAALTAGNDLAAENLFGRLAATSSGTDAASAYLQLGRLALERGEQSLAQQAFDQAAAAAPDSYFGARARDLVAGRAPFTPPAQYVFTFDELAEITAAEDWLRQTFAVTQEGPLWPLSPQLEADAGLLRARELWTVGVFDAAETEFFDVLERYEEDGLASYQLAVFLRSIGALSPSLQGAANVITASGVGTLDAPRYIARMRYPAYYRDEVLRLAQEYEFDPLLLFALIRHESLFDTYATAAAGEKGLTQVIPDTAAYIAEQLNWPDYQHSDLFRPYAGIAFGAFFLNENLDRFDGNIYAALAGYNAGPGRAIDWLEISGGDPDLFMAAITIESTQLYVQRIYSHHSIYRVLYGAPE
ncbi:MAG: tetratricopeptide repeat protein [bacterium]|nr:tetratricopeptide repeat protein [bacterium]